MATHPLPQHELGDDHLLFAYRDLILMWECAWKQRHFKSRRADLDAFLTERQTEVRLFKNSAELSTAASDFGTVVGGTVGVLWTIRRSSKPQTLLNFLRNAFAHGRYRKHQQRGVDWVSFDDEYRDQCTGKGEIRLSDLRELVLQLAKCAV